MERKRSIYIVAAIITALAINHWLLGDVVSRAAFVIVKRPFGFLQKVAVNFVKPPRDQERERFLDQTAALEKLQRENDQLRKQLGVTGKPSRAIATARVIAFEQNYVASTITIDKGTEDGLRAGLPVVRGGNILLGVVREIQPHSARVYLIDDPRVRISARLLKSSILAELKGSLGGAFSLDLIAHSEKIDLASIVVTNGLDGFPEGLVAGTIASVDDNVGGLFQKIMGKTEYNLGDSSSIFILL